MIVVGPPCLSELLLLYLRLANELHPLQCLYDILYLEEILRLVYLQGTNIRSKCALSLVPLELQLFLAMDLNLLWLAQHFH